MTCEIKRLYITDYPGPSNRREVCWEDEYGHWLLGRTTSPNTFAQGVFTSPGTADPRTQAPHPELKLRTVHADWLTLGENGPSWETECITDPVIIEAYSSLQCGLV